MRQPQDVLNLVEEDFNSPSAFVQLINALRRESLVEEIGDIEAPNAFVKEPHEPDARFELSGLGAGKLDRHIQWLVLIQRCHDVREALANPVFPLSRLDGDKARVTATFQSADKEASRFDNLLESIEGKVSQVKQIKDIWFLGDATKSTIMSLGFGDLHFGHRKRTNREFGVELQGSLSFVDAGEDFLQNTVHSDDR